ncbi:hypothetical protein [Nonomuraea angiospora]|uniref:hypothetical protein n=1 Tax=Nonomuraea angiospora TaxID=46172 RepID=UPI0029B98F32|nr:hypothetical protein [Nonomuraea angiospora]MDX3100503.1 hypothetical protein [Nonomuraea angiospora]
MRRLTAWYILDEDDGIVRRESTRKALVKWACSKYDGRVLPGTKRIRAGHYLYAIGADRDDYRQVSVFRGEALTHTAYDLEQEPLYPYASDPWELGPRGSETRETESTP